MLKTDANHEKEIIREFARFQKRWTEPITKDLTYEQALKRFTKAELDHIRRQFQIQNASQLSKDKLAAHIASNQQLILGGILPHLTTAQYNTIRKAATNGSESLYTVQGEAIWWRFLTLLIPGDLDGELELIVPLDLRNTIIDYKNQEGFTELLRKNDLILSLSKGLINTFGIVTFEHLYAELIHQGVFNGPDYHKHVQDLLWLQQSHRADYIVQYRYYAVPYFQEPAFEYDALQRRHDLRRVKLTKQQLMSRSTEDYFLEIPEYKSLRSSLQKLEGLHPDDVDGLLFEMYVMLNEDSMPTTIMNRINDKVVFDSLEQINTIMKLVSEAANATPRWFLKGHTPKELFKEEQKHLTPLPKKPFVGRNDLCPCGSGKKYKKCCMK